MSNKSAFELFPIHAAAIATRAAGNLSENAIRIPSSKIGKTGGSHAVTKAREIQSISKYVIIIH